jgi:hypothetical protein
MFRRALLLGALTGLAASCGASAPLDGGAGDAGEDGGLDAGPADAGRPDSGPLGLPCPDGGTTDAWPGWPAQFFTDNCARCHGTAWASQTAVTGDSLVPVFIHDGVMPLDGGLLPADQQRILAWLLCGGP